MSEKNKYLLIEFYLAAAISVLISALFESALKGYWIFLVLAMTGGFIFSFFAREKFKSTKYIMNTAVIFIFVWLVYRFINSSFLYRDILLIATQGMLLLLVAISFDSYKEKMLFYIYIITFLLLMVFPLSGNRVEATFIFSAALYLICWFLLLKIKFYAVTDYPLSKINFGKSYFFISILVMLVVSGIVLWALLTHIRLGKIAMGGLFPEKELDLETQESMLDHDYFALQDLMQSKITDAVSNIQNTSDKYGALRDLNSLINEMAVTKQVDDAEEGLISLLRSPGPGIEDGHTKEITIVKKYVDKKASFIMKNVQEDMANTLKNNPLDIKDRMQIMGLVNNLRRSNSPAEAQAYAQQLKQAIEDSSFDDATKDQLQKQADQIEEWKDFQLQRNLAQVQSQPVPPPPVGISPVPPEEPPPQQPPAVPPSSVISSPPETQEPQAVAEPYNPLRILLFIIGMIVAWFILFLFIIFLTFYILMQRQKKRLMSLYSNPKDFIIGLYYNLRRLLEIFGLKGTSYLTPLYYLTAAQGKYALDKDIFLRFTVKFEEAKYSFHSLKQEDAQVALDDYNNLLKDVLERYKTRSRLYAYCVSLFYRMPLFMPNTFRH